MEINIEHVTKRYGTDTILEDISFTIPQGKIVGILGVSGAGKSTLLRCINGLETYQKGSIKIGNEKLEAMSQTEIRNLRKKIGMIFQGNSLIGRKTIYKNVAFPMECSGYSKEEIEKRVNYLLKEVGIADKAQLKPKNLSGGQNQRGAIARALALNPEILLCDEATSALDPNITQGILELLAELNEKYGITIILVTHQMEVVKQLCDHVAILEKGKIVEYGPVKELFLSNPPALQRITGIEEKLSFENGEVELELFLDLTKTDVLSFLDTLDLEAARLIATKDERFKQTRLSTFKFMLAEGKLANIEAILQRENIQYQVKRGQTHG